MKIKKDSDEMPRMVHECEDCKATHTPTPWKFDGIYVQEGTKIGREKIGDRMFETIARFDKAEDAALAVRAVNCHEELLWALQRVASSGPLNNGMKDENTMAIVSEAIAKAECK